MWSCYNHIYHRFGVMLLLYPSSSRLQKWSVCLLTCAMHLMTGIIDSGESDYACRLLRSSVPSRGQDRPEGPSRGVSPAHTRPPSRPISRGPSRDSRAASPAMSRRSTGTFCCDQSSFFCFFQQGVFGISDVTSLWQPAMIVLLQ